mgnify:CR=1 FL=1
MTFVKSLKYELKIITTEGKTYLEETNIGNTNYSELKKISIETHERQVKEKGLAELTTKITIK